MRLILKYITLSIVATSQGLEMGNIQLYLKDMINKIVETLKKLTTTENVVVGGARNPEMIVFSERYYDGISDNDYNEKLREIAQKILIGIVGNIDVTEITDIYNDYTLCVVSGSTVGISIEQIRYIVGFDDSEKEVFVNIFNLLHEIKKKEFIKNILAVSKIKELLIKPFTSKSV
jgi:hypothetical protein